ncbi:hypothetical protein IJI69_04015 [Candidatus Saccharibacteria bacterium]|nr:hypothetical protein [Candidatus Saccharibacteria bacterium]
MKKRSVLFAALTITAASFFAFAGIASAEGEGEHTFNGRAWFIWNCDDDLCRYQITGLTEPTESGEDITYTTKYVKSSDVVDRDDNTKKLDLNELLNLAAATPANKLAPYLFIYDDCISGAENTCIDSIDSVTTWDGLETWWDANITDYDTQQNFAIDPTGASAGANIISTNGNRKFRATIYDDTDYYGISNASSTTDLTYYPEFWNTAFFNPAYDVSGTSLSNPKIIQSFLLEPKVTLKSDDISAPIANIEVASEGVPASAVTITPKGDGKFDIVFNSNYYDKVVFRITSGGNSYYAAIARVVVGHDYERNPVLYVPLGDSKEYDLIATYYFADGTEQTYTLEQLGGGEGGKNLEVRGYGFREEDQGKVDLHPAATNRVVGISYTTAVTGSTIDSYKGTLGGSNKGTYFKYERGSFILDITK